MLTKKTHFVRQRVDVPFNSLTLALPCTDLLNSSICLDYYMRCLPLSAQGDRTQGDDTLDESSHNPSSYVGQPLTFSQLLPTATVDDTPVLKKYWSQRYRLFSKYDEGICMDNGEYFVEGNSLLVVIKR